MRAEENRRKQGQSVMMRDASLAQRRMKIIATKARRHQRFTFNKTFCVTWCLGVLVAIFIGDFNLFQALSNVIREMIELTQKKDKLKITFNLAHLKHIHRLIKKKSDERDHIIIRQKYLCQLMIHNQRLQFTGIPDLKEKKDITILSVFVMQRAVESVDVKDYEQLMQEWEDDEEFTGDDFQPRHIMTDRREETSEPVKFDKVLEDSENQWFMVLGKPGSGKSTLVKYLMLEAAQKQLENHRAKEELLFPILVEIRKFEIALIKTYQTDYNILDYLYDSMRKTYNIALPGGFFEKYLDSGRALLLFDGLDEVAAEARRAEVRQMTDDRRQTTDDRGEMTVNQ